MTQPYRYQPEVNRTAVLARNLFAPARGQPRACAVLLGPLTSVKEQATGAYAAALAERGFQALTFDHRTFGESGGEPRQFEDPFSKSKTSRSPHQASYPTAGPASIARIGVGVCAGGGALSLKITALRASLLSLATLARRCRNLLRPRRRRLPGRVRLRRNGRRPVSPKQYRR
jgi:hypothetical protein